MCGRVEVIQYRALSQKEYGISAIRICMESISAARTWTVGPL